jgi:hypothetical protein
MRVGSLLLALVALSLSGPTPGYAAAPVAGAPTLPSGCDAPLSLTLQPGLHLDQTDWPVPANFHPPADAPPGPVILRLPLYPGATPTTHIFSASFFSYPANLYLKSGTAAFQVPADLTTEESWYRQSFSACGYVYAGGKGENAQGVGLWFRSTSSRDVIPWVVLERNPAGGTFVLYVGEVIDRPPRPHDSYLPADIVRVQIHYLLATTPEPPYPVERFIIHREDIISKLAGDINALTDVVSGGVLGCTWYGTTTLARLRFVRRGGKSVTVRVQPGCALVIVGHTRPLIDGLADAFLPVWNRIKQIVAECQDKPC